MVAGLAGCDSTPEERIAAACTAICGCEQPALPLQQQRCIGQCELDFAGVIGVSEECVACVTAHVTSCRTLRADCQRVCSVDPPIDDEPMPEFFDAVTGEPKP